MRAPRFLPPEISSLRFRLAPTDAECRAMCRDFQDKFGGIEAPRLLGVPGRTFENWVLGRGFSAGSRRCIWIQWCLLLHPDRIQTAFDLVTWGRFRVVNLPHKPVASSPADDYQI
jgi:hypothetical protein